MKSATRSFTPVSIIPAALAAALALCLVSFAQPAHAASLTQDQLQNVEQLLSSYGVSQAQINAVSAVLSDNGNGQEGGPMLQIATTSGPCAVPAHAIMRGMRGDDVTRLQDRLANEGLLTQDDVTGFFGPATQAALQSWQAQQDIVATGTPETTGWGAVGPKTLAALAQCKYHLETSGDNAASTTGHMDDRSATSTTPVPPMPMHPNLPPPAAAPQTSAGATLQFVSDYSDAFNANMAAVAEAPITFYVPILSNFFYALGVH